MKISKLCLPREANELQRGRVCGTVQCFEQTHRSFATIFGSRCQLIRRECMSWRRILIKKLFVHTNKKWQQQPRRYASTTKATRISSGRN